MKIVGKVVSGLEEGAVYMKKYRRNLEKALKMKFYSGTLNIAAKKRYIFRNPILVPAPSKNLFPVKCVKTKINSKINGAVVVPVRTKHGKNILEIIAPVNLRKELKLVNDDVIELEVEQ